MSVVYTADGLTIRLFGVYGGHQHGYRYKATSFVVYARYIIFGTGYNRDGRRRRRDSWVL
jgi:hypothetical protein